MIDKKHEDSFEEFIRKSLENHEEEPPKPTWERIAEQRRIDLVEQRPAFQWQKWMVAASFALLFSALIGQHFYFSQKISKIEEQVVLYSPNEKNEVKELTVPKPTETGLSFKKESIDKNLHETISLKSGEQEKRLVGGSEAAIAPMEHSFQEAENGIETTKKNRTVGQYTDVNKTVGIESLSKIEESKAAKQSRQVLGEDESRAVVLDNREEGSLEVAEKELDAVQAFESLDFLAKKPNAAIPSRAMAKKQPFVAPVVQTVFKTRVDLSISGGLVRVCSKPPSIKSPSSGGPGSRKDFEPRQNTLTGNQLGLTAALHLNKNWRLRTGLAYEYLSQKQSFQPDLRYSDGHHHHGGGASQEHEYIFGLNSGSSNLFIEVRAEDVGQGVNWSVDDPIAIEIETNREMESFFIPLQLGYVVQKGRWSAMLYGGPKFQWIQMDKITVNNIQLDARLRAKPDGKKGFQGRSAESLILLHGAVGGSLAYNLSEQLSVGVEYDFTKSFITSHETRRNSFSALLRYTF